MFLEDLIARAKQLEELLAQERGTQKKLEADYDTLSQINGKLGELAGMNDQISGEKKALLQDGLLQKNRAMQMFARSMTDLLNQESGHSQAISQSAAALGEHMRKTGVQIEDAAQRIRDLNNELSVCRADMSALESSDEE